MTISLRSTGALFANFTGSITPVLPSHSAGDLLLVVCSRRSATAANSIPSGWAYVPAAGGSSMPRYNASNDGGLHLFYKIASGADGNPTFGFPSTQWEIAQAFAIYGVDPADPFDVDATTAAPASTQYPDPPAITTLTDHALAMTFEARAVTTAPTAIPSGWTSWSMQGSSNVSFAVASKKQLVAGSIDPGAFDLGSAGVVGMATLALKPDPSITILTPPAYRDSTSNHFGGTTTLTCPLPSGAVAGDLLLAYVQIGTTPTITPPTGWVLAVDPDGTETNPQGGASLWWKIMGVGEPTPTWTFSAAASGAVTIVAYDGVDTTTPIEENHYAQQTASTALDWPAFQADTADALAVAIVGRYFGAVTNLHATPPSPFTERANVNADAYSSQRWVWQVSDADTIPGYSMNPGTQGAVASSTRVIWLVVLKTDGSAGSVDEDSLADLPYAVVVM